MGFVYMKEELVSPSMLFFISAMATLISYCFYITTCWENRTKSGNELAFLTMTFLGYFHFSQTSVNNDNNVKSNFPK